MEWLFRKHFWIVHLIGLAICAFLLANTVKPILARALASKFAPKEEDRPALAMTQEPVRDFSAANERNIFGAKREQVSVVNGSEEITDGRVGSWENAVPSTLKAKLVGTAVFLDPTYSLATVVDQVKGLDSAPQSYSINDCQQSAAIEDPELREVLGMDAGPVGPCNRFLGVGVLIRIEPERVIFYNESDHRYEYLALEGEEYKPLPVATLEPSGAPNLGDLVKGVRATGPNSFEIKQNSLDEALANLSAISTQARVVPAFENGKPIGFRMFAIMPDSVFSKIGFKNGDILTRVNGYDINSPDKALELYNKLKNTKQFSVDMKRGGKPSSLDYSVVP